MNRCETITLLDIPQQPRQAVPFTEADLRALLRRHREGLVTGMLALFRKAGWPTSRAALLVVLAEGEDEDIRRILQASGYVPPGAEQRAGSSAAEQGSLDATTDAGSTPARSTEGPTPQEGESHE